MISVLAQLGSDELLHQLSALEPAAAACILAELIEDQERRNDRNLIKPYQERVPGMLTDLEESRVVELLGRLDPALVWKALLKNFRSVPAGLQVRLLQRIRPAHAARVFERLSFGLDGPRTAVRLLRRMPSAACRAILAEMAPRLRRWLMEATGCRFPPVPGAVSPFRRVKEVSSSPDLDDEFTPNEIARLARDWSADVLVSRLETLDPRAQAFVLRELDPPQAVDAVARLAGRDPARAAEVLEEMDIRILMPAWPDTSVEGDVITYSSRLACFLEHLDPHDARLLNLLDRVREDRLRTAFARLRWESRARLAAKVLDGPGYSPVGFPQCTGTGRKRTRSLPGGLRWTRIQEVLRVNGRMKHVQIDVVAMDSARIRARSCASVARNTLVPLAAVQAMLGSPRRDDGVSRAPFFEQMGGIQLRRAVRVSGALAGINGNFYFDYGNYLDAIDLGLDISGVPGLLFGDLLGWLVCDGVEVSPPIFNRAALVVTADGRFHIRKVFVREVIFGRRWRVRWHRLNARRSRCRVVLYNSLYGLQTEPDPGFTDLVIVGGRILAIAPGGHVRIPLTGFVLSMPNEQAGEILAGAGIGDPVEVVNDFPSHLGAVEQAMACGPQLVRDGQPDLNFDFEDFGDKDSTVLPLSLTRAVETFEAARSFVMLQGEQVLLGTVSGVSLGSGEGGHSRGVTFGELGQFAVDWGADQAVALDGGGSSSIVVQWGDEVRVLNVPTGGSDVPPGAERFINTYWLFFPA